MNKVVVYWSGTGNTEALANKIASDLGLDALSVSNASVDKVLSNDLIIFGCPAMGAEVLEESEFDPMFTAVESALAGKKIGLFGSYGWGDGQWMRDWEERCKSDGVVFASDSVTANNAPDDSALDECRSLGMALA